MKTVGKLVLSSIVGLLAFGAMLFLPAGTLHYWQAWAFLGGRAALLPEDVQAVLPSVVAHRLERPVPRVR